MKFVIDGEEYIEAKDVQKMIGIKQSLLYEKVRYGVIPKPYEKKATIERKRKLWKKSEIEEFIAKAKKEQEKHY